MSAKRHKSSHSTDAVKLALMLSELRLPAMKQMWSGFAERADTEGWPAARLLSTLAELELAERDRRRIERHLKEARLVPGKTISSFDFNVVPVVSKSKVMALAAGDVWLNNGHNLLMFGPPGTGKSHLSSAIGLALVENGYRVLFTRTTDLVQHACNLARRELLRSKICWRRLDRYHRFWTILPTSAKIKTSVLFELISVQL